jgi:HAD superfamily hydrolase (TIGR01549 family)
MSAAFHDTLKEYGIIEPVNTIMSFMKLSMGDTIRHYKEKYQLGDAFFERYKILNTNAENENTKPFDGVVELCNAICKNGGKNYLFTHRGGSAAYYLEKYELLTNFTELITSKQNFPRKPSPEAILYLINKYRFSNDEALMIGDRDLDILSAKNAGIHTCYFTNGGRLSDTAEYNINSFLELYRILDIENK